MTGFTLTTHVNPPAACRGQGGAGAGGAGRPVLSWIHRVNITLDAARGLEYLHEIVRPAVTHKDVRSTNVLLFEGFRAKIADYNMFSQAADMARLNRSTHTLGSFGYQAPEYVFSPGLVCLLVDCAAAGGF
jgi:pto-interacting protein 1